MIMTTWTITNVIDALFNQSRWRRGKRQRQAPGVKTFGTFLEHGWHQQSNMVVGEHFIPSTRKWKSWKAFRCFLELRRNFLRECTQIYIFLLQCIFGHFVTWVLRSYWIIRSFCNVNIRKICIVTLIFGQFAWLPDNIFFSCFYKGSLLLLYALASNSVILVYITTKYAVTSMTYF